MQGGAAAWTVKRQFYLLKLPVATAEVLNIGGISDLRYGDGLRLLCQEHSASGAALSPG
jgi:hypothetical protein